MSKPYEQDPDMHKYLNAPCLSIEDFRSQCTLTPTLEQLYIDLVKNKIETESDTPEIEEKIEDPTSLFHKLTNADISENYRNCKFNLMLNDFRGAFAYGVVKQFPTDDYKLIAKAIDEYTKFLQKRYFKNKDVVMKMDWDMIKKLTDEDIFIAIPKIYALNQIEPDFIDLGALSRNVFYHILREQITQPL